MIRQRKSRFGKTFFSCSNYPDCDVIGNEPDDVRDKYTGRPKTASVKKEKKKRGAAKKTAKKAPIQSATYQVSKELAAVLGATELSRPAATKKIWEYIKAHDLQDPSNKRLIRPDAALEKVFGSKEPVDMMKLSSILSRHLKR